MSTVKRKATIPKDLPYTDVVFREAWQRQCLQDLAAGRHARRCRCLDGIPGPVGKPANACTLIVRCALELRSYECEVGDA